MVNLDVVRSANAALVKSQPLVAVFIGGTSGIGEFTVKALARTHGETGQGLRLYIIGRNASAAEATFSECRAVCPRGQFIFVQADNLALLNDVDEVSSKFMDIEKREGPKDGKPRIDLLVMSTGSAIFAPRNGISRRGNWY